MTIEQMLDSARQRIVRLTPPEAWDRFLGGATLIDVRTSDQRRHGGTIPGSVPIGLNVLEWRVDPTSPSRLDGFDDLARELILLCEEGYSSSLAAARLVDLGYAQATDVVGGFTAWVQAGLPVERATR